MAIQRSLTYQPVEKTEKECPPTDTYILEVLSIGEFEERNGVLENGQPDPNVVNTQSKITFEIVDWEFDPDEDEKDWNGVKISDYFVFWREYKDKEVTSDVWRDERSNAYALITAILKRDLEPGEEILLPELVGERLKATIEPKKSGWPKVTKPIPYRKKKSTAKAKGTNVYDEDAA